jgi:methionyl-tRNA formyltransferase
MTKKRWDLLFLGAGELAVPSLEALAAAGRSPTRIVTRRIHSGSPSGRGRTSAVAKWATAHDVDATEVKSSELGALAERMKSKRPDIVMVADFGRPVPPEILQLARTAAVGLHFSLLPKLRGADPIRAAIAEGDRETGVTTFLLEEDLESGPILLQERLEIGPRETYGELAPRLAELGGQVLTETVGQLTGKKKMKGRKQNEEAATHAPCLTRRHRKAPWWHSADVVYNRLRAHLPEHGLHAGVRRRPVEILWGSPMEWVNAPFGSVGTYLGLRLGRVAVLCGENSVFGIDRIRLQDGEPMRASDLAYEIGLDVGHTFT